MPPKEIAANAFELGLVALGWFLIWRLQFSAAAREKRKSAPTTWPREPMSRKGAVLTVLWVALAVGLYTGVGQLCIVTGGLIALLSLQIENLKLEPMAPGFTPTKATVREIGKASLMTFVVVVSVIHPVQLLWEQFLIVFHLPTEKQALVEMFIHPESFAKTSILIANAVILAPIAEELFFRAGLFRTLSPRFPRWIAIILPALIFASLHVDRTNLKGLITLAPLTAFGIIFSLAYERTGRIAVVMIAHGLFNLHTVVFLLLGLTN